MAITLTAHILALYSSKAPVSAFAIGSSMYSLIKDSMNPQARSQFKKLTNSCVDGASHEIRHEKNIGKYFGISFPQIK